MKQNNDKFEMGPKGIAVYLALGVGAILGCGLMGNKLDEKSGEKSLEAKVVQTQTHEQKVQRVNDYVNELNRDLPDYNSVDKVEEKIIDYRTNNFENDSDALILARMIYGEARNCSDEEKIAVAYTAINRANDGKKWNGETVKDSILKPWQYSCFNKNDVNREKLKNPQKEVFKKCLDVAEDVLEGKYSELNKGQTHYHTIEVHPSWVDKLDKIEFENTKHKFYVER